MSNWDYKIDDIETGGMAGLDAFFAAEPGIVTPLGQEQPVKPEPQRIRITSVQQLQGFVRTANDTLINKATQDLWAIRKNGDDFFIERLFEDNGEPLKG